MSALMSRRSAIIEDSDESSEEMRMGMALFEDDDDWDD